MKITVEIEVDASPKEVWDAWVSPDHITKWNFATDAWCCPRAVIDLRPGGGFNYRMEARDGSVGFDFEGVFVKTSPYEFIHYELGDGRLVTVEFKHSGNTVSVVETFEAEDENSAAQQKQGWQSILTNFKQHVESKRS
jgi:uncharacterized protein YndB with AHSA1/START domain